MLKIHKRSKSLVFVLASFILIMSPIAFFFIYYENRVYPNISISGIDVSGKTKSEVVALLDPKTNIPESLTLNYQDKKFIIPIDTLNISLDKNKTVDKALELGRSGNIIGDVNEILTLFKKGKNFPLEFSFNKDLLTSSINDIASQINIEPKDAQFTVVNNIVKNFSLETDGLLVNKTNLINNIAAEINKNSSDKISLDIPTQIASAQIKASDVNNLGIKELIGSGTSHFAGSASSRIHNVNLAASRLNNTLIPPDANFSFVQTLGDISVYTGFVQAYIIQNGQTILGDGGGVCQVSTTMFRAAMNSGLPITERHAHAYRVHYYEEDALPGLDATIYSPTVDLKFKNDTGNYVLVQTEIDLKNLVLTFNLYGTKDGRTVEITKPKLWDAKPAPEPLYTDDPTLPVGVVKQIDFSAPGLKSQFKYTVTRNGETINHQTFYSDFKPWQAKFLRGTKI